MFGYEMDITRFFRRLIVGVCWYAILGLKNILVCQMIYAAIWDVGFKAALHNSANV
jgi:hypothetical protein